MYFALHLCIIIIIIIIIYYDLWHADIKKNNHTCTNYTFSGVLLVCLQASWHFMGVSSSYTEVEWQVACSHKHNDFAHGLMHPAWSHCHVYQRRCRSLPFIPFSLCASCDWRSRHSAGETWEAVMSTPVCAPPTLVPFQSVLGVRR